MAQETEPAYLAGLNDAQREAVYHKGRPLLILAGAGSGKTRVITTKIAYFIRELGVKPYSILAVTFTNKAAREMAARAGAIEGAAKESMIRTFHSFGAWFLRRNSEAAGLSPSFNIYDDDDSVALLGSVSGKKKDELRMYAHKIARAKDRGLGPDSEELSEIDYSGAFRDLYLKYEERLRETGNADFGDLIKKPVEVLRGYRDIAERTRARFRVIMVDEYQDANIAQFELLRELYGGGAYLCVVGDDDQSIYRFRGAEVRNILDFPALFGGADIIKLEENYRSTEEILALAHSVVRHNSGRHGKKLVSARGPGKTPRLRFLDDQDDEAALCASLITKAVLREGGKYSDWALLYRTNAQSLSFESEFVRRKIPYKIVGSLKFYEREEIKDALALLSFMINPRDEVSFRRVINKPARGAGPAAVEKILEERLNTEGWNIEAATRASLPRLSAKARAGALEFLAAIQRGRLALSGEEKNSAPSGAEGDNKKRALIGGAGLSCCVAALVEASGIAKYHLEHDVVSGEQRISNLQELVNTATLYEANEAGLLEFLEHIELDRGIELEDAGEDRVTLITLHNTKGMEYKNVIMTGLEQGLFPRADKKEDDLEEERRLFYVGATRAMDELYLTSCVVRRMWGSVQFMTPSVFLEEAGLSHFIVEGSAPKAFGAREGVLGASRAGPDGRGKVSSDGRWRIGERVFNDDNGYGEVAGIEEGKDGPVIKIYYETGRAVKFLSAAQSKNYMKVKD
ncbi:MAG: ATP-dependent helicase [Spirochaetaceae bacterium]|jgi:DNA helicase-2/ATP-dependent DNA helicase PcrA|nr:ATP-dependent helicase [Spirochaetaceae bacterium]